MYSIAQIIHNFIWLIAIIIEIFVVFTVIAFIILMWFIFIPIIEKNIINISATIAVVFVILSVVFMIHKMRNGD